MAPTRDPLTLATLRLREPNDVVEAVPYLLGFHPTESIVVLGVSQRRYECCVRANLPALNATAEQFRDLVSYLTRVMLRQQIDGVLLVGYGSADRVDRVMGELAPTYARLGFQVLELLRAEDNRYWSYLCDRPDCCPPEGAPFNAYSGPIAAARTVAGQVVSPDRDSYEAQLEPVGGAARTSMRAAAARADERLLAMLTHPPDEGSVQRAIVAAGREALAAALGQHRAGKRLTDDEVAWLANLVASASVRDQAWAQISGGRAGIEPHRTLWMDVMRRCQPDLSAGPASLFAFAAWRCGEGPLAQLALERVLAVYPTYRVAEVLHRFITEGRSPDSMRNLRNLRRRYERRPRRRSGWRRVESRRG